MDKRKKMINKIVMMAIHTLRTLPANEKRAYKLRLLYSQFCNLRTPKNQNAKHRKRERYHRRITMERLAWAA